MGLLAASLEGKIALVTGATRGIGQQILLTLGQMGATVIGTATSERGAEMIAQVCEQHKIKGYAKVLNVADLESIENTLEAITKEVGSPLILVNNAGITRDNLLMRMKDEEWEQVLQTNLTGVFRMTRACVRAMVKARWGRIISISSVVGATGNPGQANYAAAKAGVVAFSKSLAKEIASRHVTVNVVAPGFIETDMTNVLTDAQKTGLLQMIPAGVMGQPEDIAAGVAFLASEQARYITGETLHINGGMYMS